MAQSVLVPVGEVSTVAFNTALEAINRNIRGIGRVLETVKRPRILYENSSTLLFSGTTGFIDIFSATVIGNTITERNSIKISVNGSFTNTPLTGTATVTVQLVADYASGTLNSFGVSPQLSLPFSDNGSDVVEHPFLAEFTFMQENLSPTATQTIVGVGNGKIQSLLADLTRESIGMSRTNVGFNVSPETDQDLNIFINSGTFPGGTLRVFSVLVFST